MPRTGAPPMMGETPTTVCARSAAAMPGTARITPMLTTGFDGGNSTKSAAAIASSTPGAGRASAAPTASMRTAGTAAWSLTHHSWKCSSCIRPSTSTVTWVRTGSSDIGSSVTPGRQRRQSCCVTSDSVRPCASSSLRRMCVAMSLSPRPNQPGPAP